MKFIFFSEFSKRIGSGHLIRSKRLYNQLSKKYTVQYFLNKDKKYIKNFIKKKKEKVIFIFDLKKYCKFHKLTTNFCIYFDNNINSAKNSININPLLPFNKKYHGPKWHIYPKDFNVKTRYLIKQKKRKILVCQGGTDPHGNILKLIKIIKNKIKDIDFELHILTSNKIKIKKNLLLKYKVKEYKNIKNLSNFFTNYEHIVTSCGNISLEINFLGIPTTYVSSEKREIKLGKYFENKGFGNFFYVSQAKKIQKHIYKELQASKRYKINIMKNKIKYFRHDGLKNILNILNKLNYEI